MKVRQFRLQNGAKLMKIQRGSLQIDSGSYGAFKVYEFSERIAVERARWLAELSATLEDARRVANELSITRRGVIDAELYARIEAARAEIRDLQLRRVDRFRPGNDPEWSILWTEPSAG